MQEEASALLGQAQADIRNLERELRAKRAQIAKLRDDQYEMRKASKHFPEALEVVEHWRQTCQPQARDIASKARVVPVMDMLDAGWTKDELMRVVDGYAAYPFVVNGERVDQGPESKRFVKVETIFANEDRVLVGLRLAYRATSGLFEDLLTWRFATEEVPAGVVEQHEAALNACRAYYVALRELKAEIARSGVAHKIERS